MKKKILIVIAFIIAIILTILLFFVKSKSTSTENDNNSYICFKEQQKVEFANVDYYYKFDVIEGNIENTRQEIVFTYFKKSIYENSDVKNSFTISPPDKIETNDKKLTESFIWNTMIPKEKEDTVEEYIKIVETYGYKCEIDK